MLDHSQIPRRDFLSKSESVAENRDPGEIDSLEGRDRFKSALRMNYEAQVSRIRKQIGDLEDVRKTLGLSQRKMCQLLLVDPSAWSRWTKPSGSEGSSSAPPHIWRSLQWYMALNEKIPGLNESYFLGAFTNSSKRESIQSEDKILSEETFKKLQELVALQRQYEKDLNSLKKRLRFFAGGAVSLWTLAFFVMIFQVYFH